jgi:hypothetical protein
MGSFEKLGILVIVVIIVMILAVAIYQWGGTGMPGMEDGAFGGNAVPLVVTPTARPENVPEIDYIDRDGRGTHGGARDSGTPRDSGPVLKITPEGRTASGSKRRKAPAGEWAGGIPHRYTVKKNDIMWNVVVKRWKLKESFCDAIARANPKINLNRLGTGRVLQIPDPQAFVPGGKSTRASNSTSFRMYEIQVGDRLETISRAHLGKKSRWREIVAVNPGLSPEKIRPGQKIRIPAR